MKVSKFKLFSFVSKKNNIKFSYFTSCYLGINSISVRINDCFVIIIACFELKLSFFNNLAA